MNPDGSSPVNDAIAGLSTIGAQWYALTQYPNVTAPTPGGGTAYTGSPVTPQTSNLFSIVLIVLVGFLLFTFVKKA